MRLFGVGGACILNGDSLVLLLTEDFGDRVGSFTLVFMIEVCVNLIS